MPRSDAALDGENDVSTLSGMIQCYLTRGTTRREHTSSICTLVDERRAESTMSQEENVRAMLTSSDVAQLPVREHVGLAIQAADVVSVISRIREAEQVGIQQVWMTQSMGMLDTLTLFASAATQTTRIR